MKKSMMAVAAALCAGVAGTASAESAVTLYGILDQSIGYVNNVGGKGLFNSASGEMSGSRWGLKGSEDLGAGLKAIFRLESGFDLGTGRSSQDGRLFGRQAYVGLSSDAYGTMTLGRQYDVFDDFVLPNRLDLNGSFGDHPFDFDNFGSTLRSENAIKFTSANYGGFSFGGSASPSGVAGAPGKQLVWSIGAGYKGGALSAGIGYLDSRDPKTSPLSRIFSEEWIARSQTNDVRYRVLGASAAYRIEAATISAAASDTRFKASMSPAISGWEVGTELRGISGEIGLAYQFTPALSAGVGYSYLRVTEDKQPGKAHFHQLSVGTDYLLSKRTDVYLIGAVQRAKGSDAQMNGLERSSTGSQASVRVGVRHRF